MLTYVPLGKTKEIVLFTKMFHIDLSSIYLHYIRYFYLSYFLGLLTDNLIEIQ
jgi:hypothetical protein